MDPKAEEILQQRFPAQTLHRLFKNRLAVFGLIIITIQVLMAILAPLIVVHAPYQQNVGQPGMGIAAEGHWLGTDNLGRDIWSRLVYGARISLLVGVISVVLSSISGLMLGVVAGYYKRIDGIIMRTLDLFFAFPGILLAILIIAMFGTNLINAVAAISIWFVPSSTRLVRGSVLSAKKQERMITMTSPEPRGPRMVLKSALQNCTAPLMVFATMRMATAILSVSTLGFLRLGAQQPTPEWGAMIAAGQDFMWNAPHLTIIPGIAIILVVFAYNAVGDGLRDVFDPSM